MKLALTTPALTINPAHATEWEQTASIEDVARVAEAADRLGYDHLTCAEHVGVTAEEAPRRGSRYYDPLATFGFLAARTERIRFATAVLVLGYHHPLEIAKRYGTLDVVSGGRLVLGLGVGTLEAEFTLLGAPFTDRGVRADDALRALRASLSQPEPAYSGAYYDFAGLVVDPCAVQPRVPLWVGGRTLRSLRRAVTLAGGWCPFGLTPVQVRGFLDQVEVPAGFEVVVPPPTPLDPVGDPAATQAALQELVDAGVTIASAWFVHRSLEHYLEQLEALVELHPS